MKLIALAVLIALPLLSACDRNGPGRILVLPSPTATSVPAPPVEVPGGDQAFVPFKEGDGIDFNVKGIRLGTAYTDAIKELGKPVKSRKIKIDECGEDTHLILDYPGLKLDLTAHVEFRVGKIEVTSSKWLVEPGVLVGSGMEDVRAKLGNPWNQSEEDGFAIMHYLVKEGLDPADLYFLNGKMVKIILWVNPC
jgi:hypothetical protein